MALTPQGALLSLVTGLLRPLIIVALIVGGLLLVAPELGIQPLEGILG